MRNNQSKKENFHKFSSKEKDNLISITLLIVITEMHKKRNFLVMLLSIVKEEIPSKTMIEDAIKEMLREEETSKRVFNKKCWINTQLEVAIIKNKFIKDTHIKFQVNEVFNNKNLKKYNIKNKMKI